MNIVGPFWHRLLKRYHARKAIERHRTMAEVWQAWGQGVDLILLPDPLPHYHDLVVVVDNTKNDES